MGTIKALGPSVKIQFASLSKDYVPSQYYIKNKTHI